MIQSARELFAANGFHNTGIAQIARDSGVLVGQIYRDFASKEDIVAAIVEHDLDIVLNDAALSSAVERGDPAAVRAWIRWFVAADEVPDHRLIAEIIAEGTRNGRIAAIVEAANARLHATILRALEILAPGAALAMRRALAADMILTLSGGILHRRFKLTVVEEPELVALLLAMVDREIDALARPHAGLPLATVLPALLGLPADPGYSGAQTSRPGGTMAVADAHKVASAIEAVVHQADAAYVGVVAILQTLFNKGVLNQDEIKAIADAMVASIPTERHHAFAQSLSGMLPDYKTPRAASISAG